MNIIMALVLFIVAFAIGVPFSAANVGEVERSSSPAWQAGIQRGDKIVRVNDVRDPVFEQLARAVALGGGGKVRLEVERGGQLLSFDVKPEYDPALGLQTIGVLPQFKPVVTGLATLETDGGVAPAKDAGVELGDKILAINGTPVKTAGDVRRQLLDYPEDDIALLVERNGEKHTLQVHTVPVKTYMLGISAIGSTVKDVQPGGPAQQAGLLKGDDITAVSGTPVRSVIGLQEALGKVHGTATIDVKRDGKSVTLTAPVPDGIAAGNFVDSLAFKSGITLTWVKQGSPAYEAGMRPGDKLLTVADKPVDSWAAVLDAGAKAGQDPRQMEWSRDGKVISASLAPALASAGEEGGLLGIEMAQPVMVPRHYGVVGAVTHGLRNFWDVLHDFLGTVHGIATHTVSSRMLGGIVTIVRVTHAAAEYGLGKLLYITAFLSASIAFLNILPIPILDGGHLLFLAIEKLRGRRVSEKAMAIAQTVGGVLLIALVVYVTRNDIMNWMGVQ